MINSKVQYALVLVHEVREAPPETAVALQSVSEKYNISIHFLEQVARKLRLAKILKSKRGPGGGYVADEAMQGLSLLSLLNAMEASNVKISVKSEDSQTLVAHLVTRLSESLEAIKL